MERTPEDILDECIERLTGGTPVETLLAAYPRHAALLAPALRSARMLLSAPLAEAGEAVRLAAMRRMLDQLDSSAKPPIVGGWFAAFKRRPLAFQAATLASSIALFGALGVGASAATGTAPEPVRDLFRFSFNSQIRVEFDGLITMIDADASTLGVAEGGDVRTVHITASTELSRGGHGIALGDFALGDQVEVRGALQPDDTILASRVHLEDDGDAGTTPAADPTAEAGTPDDADGGGVDGGDNSGPGGGDDSGSSDNGGPGSDDGAADDDSGPGSEHRTPTPGASSTPDADDENSGSGGGDGGGNDNSGPGGADETPHSEDTPESGG